MDSNQRLFLAIILILAVFIGFQFLMPKAKTPPAPAVDTAAVAQSQPAPATIETPPAAQSGKQPTPKKETLPVAEHRLSGHGIEAVFSTRGAALTACRLPDYKGPNGQPVQLIPDSGNALTLDLIADGKPLDLGQTVFALSFESENELVFEAKLDNGILVRKTYRILQSAPGLDLTVEIDAPEKVYLGPRYHLSWNCGLNPTEKNLVLDHKEFAALVMLGDKKSIDLDNLSKLSKQDNADTVTNGDIVFCGLRTKYFVAALAPKNGNGVYVKRGTSGKDKISTSLGRPLNHQVRDEITVYIGPIDHAMLAKAAPSLDKIADTGWSWIQPISRGILWLLLSLHKAIPNYGWVIVIFSVLMKLVFFPLTYTGMRSMKKMQHLQPHLKRVQEQHKNDPGRMNQETMALYKKHGVNPFSGCLPLLLQMPVFFALYSVLVNTIELRQAPFVLWIKDLSQPDAIINFGFKLPIFGWESLSLLPILMGVAMFFQQKMTTVDPKQKMMVYFMPVFMAFIFMTLPAGLNLYWLVNNILSIGEQYIIHTRTKPLAEE
jgi:YidC/Oxa1 family membrane protein insertase